MEREEPVSKETDEISMETDSVSTVTAVANGSVDIDDNEGINEEELTRHGEIENETLVLDERSLDHFLFGVVHVLCKIFSTCTVVRSAIHRTIINRILGKIHTHTHTLSLSLSLSLSHSSLPLYL